MRWSKTTKSGQRVGSGDDEILSWPLEGGPEQGSMSGLKQGGASELPHNRRNELQC